MIAVPEGREKPLDGGVRPTGGGSPVPPDLWRALPRGAGLLGLPGGPDGLRARRPRTGPRGACDFGTAGFSGKRGAGVEQRQLETALIVDDHPLFCDALSMTLRAIAGLRQIETADRLEDALARLEQGPAPDVVVLDLNLPDVTGIEGLIRVRAAAGAVPVVVVSSLADNRVIAAALKAGAAGFVPKHARRDVFRAAFDAIRAGGGFVPEGFVAPADTGGPATQTEDAIARLALLTRQQAKILSLVCEGRLNKQIAYDLAIAETTVKAHVTAIMRKLGVQSRTQAVLIAREASFSNLMPENG